jgi:hypothetical protein
MMKQLGVLLVAIAAFGCSVARASADEYSPPPYLLCFNTIASVETVIEHSREPAVSAQLSFGAPVTFSANATIPVTFVLATNADMTPPYLDEATVTPGPNGVASFNSSKATSAIGGVWWTVSFSSSSIPECAGQSPRTFTMASNAFTVVGPPPEPVVPPPSVAAPQAPSKVVTCVVPDLRGLDLPKARELLSRHSCKLGRVGHESRLRTKGMVVVKQALPAGSRQRDGAPVDVTLGAPRRHRR